MKVLAIDTVTEACSAALWINSEIIERFVIEPRGHTELILPMIESLLAEADISLGRLDAIAVNRGPGSFTGVRICAGVAQGLAFSAQLPVVPVSSLQALAQQAYLEAGYQQTLSMIDARMNEVYWGTYHLRDSHMQLEGTEQVSSVISIPPGLFETHIAIGSGAAEYLTDSEKSKMDLKDSLRLPRAATIAMLAAELDLDKVTAESYEPVYLRNNVVHS